MSIGYTFPKQRGLDSKFMSWVPKRRIPRHSSSEVYRSKSRSKYFKIDSLIYVINRFMGLQSLEYGKRFLLDAYQFLSRIRQGPITLMSPI